MRTTGALRSRSYPPSTVRIKQVWKLRTASLQSPRECWSAQAARAGYSGTRACCVRRAAGWLGPAMESAELLEDRFEIEYRVQGGGMGEVFRARDRASGTPAAIKVLATRQDPRGTRFAREIQLLSELSHPGIVRYVAHGVTPAGAPFLVMEWLDGEDLRRRLEREPLSIGESVALAARVAEALGAAHARGIGHRDLKPSNLFLTGGRIDQVKGL